MKTGLAKTLLAGGTAAVLLLSMSFLPLARAYATSPYFKVLGGDAMAGGWFSDASGTNCTSSANFQDDKYQAGDNSYGGIYTFAQSGGSGYEGSSSQYGAFALGQIDGTSAPNGFYSDAAVNPTKPDTLSFANINSLNPPGFIGGLWGGSTRSASQCIPDYYDTKMPKTTVALSGPGGFGNPQSNGTVVYTADGTASPYVLTNSPVKIKPNADIAIFVDGNVYIDHDITYAGGGNLNNMPRFAIVARGSIYIDPSVKQLDGLYIAQPPASVLNGSTTVTDDTGIVWTCHDGTTTAYTGSQIATNCGNNLTINGAVITKQINLLRVNTGDVSDNNANPAEVINYSPDMLSAGPFFPTDSEINNTFTEQPVLQSLISLPPVF